MELRVKRESLKLRPMKPRELEVPEEPLPSSTLQRGVATALTSFEPLEARLLRAEPPLVPA